MNTHIMGSPVRAPVPRQIDKLICIASDLYGVCRFVPRSHHGSSRTVVTDDHSGLATLLADRLSR